MTKFHIVLAIFGTFAYFWYFIGVSEAAMTSIVCDEIPTEAEKRSQFRRRRAVSSAPVPLARTNRKRSGEPLEEASDNGMNHFRWG